MCDVWLLLYGRYLLMHISAVELCKLPQYRLRLGGFDLCLNAIIRLAHLIWLLYIFYMPETAFFQRKPHNLLTNMRKCVILYSYNSHERRLEQVISVLIFGTGDDTDTAH